MHRVTHGEPTRGARLELLARLEQAHFARRRLAESELGRDAPDDDRGEIAAADAGESAVVASKITVKDHKGRRMIIRF